MGGALGHDMRHALPFPTYIERAQGAYKWDVDGHRYIDYHVGNGALLLGHAHPAIVEAVIKAAPLGTHFGNDHPLQVEWAEKIQSLVPCGERVRFTNSGTESDMLACRVARAHTGRPTILRFEGHFHGWGDELVTGFAPPLRRAAVDRARAGLPARHGHDARPTTSTRWTGSSASVATSPRSSSSRAAARGLGSRSGPGSWPGSAR